MTGTRRVIHALHESLDQVWTTPASVNLIEGTRDEVIAFLDSLAYGDTADPAPPIIQSSQTPTQRTRSGC